MTESHICCLWNSQGGPTGPLRPAALATSGSLSAFPARGSKAAKLVEDRKGAPTLTPPTDVQGQERLPWKRVQIKAHKQVHPCCPPHQVPQRRYGKKEGHEGATQRALDLTSSTDIAGQSDHTWLSPALLAQENRVGLKGQIVRRSPDPLSVNGAAGRTGHCPVMTTADGAAGRAGWRSWWDRDH